MRITYITRFQQFPPTKRLKSCLDYKAMPDFSEIPHIAPPYQLTHTRHGVMLVNRNDIYMGQSFLRYGECCEHEVQVLLQLLSHPRAQSGLLNSGLVVEVGSNMGVHTVPLAQELARQNRFGLAFEPQPVIFQQLCANLALNGLMNVTALPYACSSEPGQLCFSTPNYRSPGNFGGTAMAAASITPQSPDDSIIQRVPCHPLDSLVRLHCEDKPVALIKIDVEGHELRVLQGAQDIITRFHPILYVENDRVKQSRSLIQWLLDCGYRLWWHITRAFNPSNFLQNQENIYGDTCLFNMLCVHSSSQLVIEGLPEIVDASSHPLAPAQPAS
jgi:FkbM family methyltransferase